MRIVIFILLVLLWVFGPSVFTIADLNYTIASFVWILQYSYLWLAVSYGFITPNILGFLFHLPRFLFLLYVMQALGKSTEFKKALSYGFLAELPFILGAVYYALFPPGVYSYYLVVPVPIITIIGVLLLMRKPHVK